jgi:hypothetical protein
MQVHFGSGALFGTPLQDAFGTAVASPTLIKFGVMQDITLDISFDLKELYGQNQFPIAIGRGKGKITGQGEIRPGERRHAQFDRVRPDAGERPPQRRQRRQRRHGHSDHAVPDHADGPELRHLGE